MTTPDVIRDLETVADNLVRQVQEFSGWDEKDWPAAYAVLMAQADFARKALERFQAEDLVSSTKWTGLPFVPNEAFTKEERREIEMERNFEPGIEES